MAEETSGKIGHIHLAVSEGGTLKQMTVGSRVQAQRLISKIW